MASFEIGKTYSNDGVTVQAIAVNKKIDKYLLLRLGKDGNPLEYIVCSNFDSESVEWDFGHYFSLEDSASALCEALKFLHPIILHVIHGHFTEDDTLYFDCDVDYDALVHRFYDEVKYQHDEYDMFGDYFIDEDGEEITHPEDSEELFDDLCEYLVYHGDGEFSADVCQL